MKRSHNMIIVARLCPSLNRFRWACCRHSTVSTIICMSLILNLQGNTLSGMKITPFILLGIQLEHRQYVSCTKCLQTRFVRLTSSLSSEWISSCWKLKFSKPIQAFRGYENTSENWVLSLTAICGAFNGSTRTYITGMKWIFFLTIYPSFW